MAVGVDHRGGVGQGIEVAVEAERVGRSPEDRVEAAEGGQRRVVLAGPEVVLAGGGLEQPPPEAVRVGRGAERGQGHPEGVVAVGVGDRRGARVEEGCHIAPGVGHDPGAADGEPIAHGVDGAVEELAAAAVDPPDRDAGPDVGVGLARRAVGPAGPPVEGVVGVADGRLAGHRGAEGLVRGAIGEGRVPARGRVRSRLPSASGGGDRRHLIPTVRVSTKPSAVHP